MVCQGINSTGLDGKGYFLYKGLKRQEFNIIEGKSSEMTIQDVLALIQLFEANGIDLVIDGGWGVDALLGEQTRIHSDLDIAIQHQDVTLARSLLEERGYKDVPRNDTRDCNFVLGDDQGRLIDFHTYTFDAQGKLIFGVEYPFDSLTGRGSIMGHPVRCIPPDWMVKFHSGYTLDENDYHDVSALCHKFGIPLPPEFDTFIKAKAT
jgi:lincosamide nucleotidyltransferase A/C/D/E